MTINDALTWILDLVASVDPVLRTILAGVGMLLETSILLGLVIPGDSIVLVASTAVRSPVEYVALLLVVIVGALGGESIGFAIGRYFGPRIRRSRLGQAVGERHWQRAENYVDRRGGLAVFVSRFLPVLHSLVPVVVGMSTMTYRRFLTWTIPACLVWSIAWVTFGSVAAQSYREVADELHSAGYFFVAAVIVFVAISWGIKKFLARREARHMAVPGDGDANTLEDS